MRRKLNIHEHRLAQQVFQNKLPYGRVSVVDTLGLGGAPYTLNFMGLDDADANTYVLHVGPVGFAGMQLSPYWSGVLIHELTHVWQSYNSAWPATFIFKSIGCQIAQGRTNAYIYESGKPWKSYNVEQQASIVADWFSDGQDTTDGLYPYIRDQIRTGRNAM
jgi:hypothetical protein